jgi:hypothetical protein
MRSVTARQREVIDGISRHLTYKEIGAELGIAERTVKAHADTSRWKLRVAKARRLPEAVREHDKPKLESCVVMGDDYFWFGDTSTPRTALGACKECGQHWSVGHLGTCSHSQMRSGGLEALREHDAA